MQLLNFIAQQNTVNLSLRLTLATFLLVPVGDFLVRPIILSLALIGLVFRSQLHNQILWLALTILTAIRVLVDWPLADNHAYLLCYWCLAIFIALYVNQTKQCLALNARLLIGFVFLFATIWKLVLSSDYADSQFFRVIMITDSRFEGFTQLVAGLSKQQIEGLRNLVEPSVYNTAANLNSSVQLSTRFNLVASIASYWNIVINAMIALAFMWPVERGFSKVRDVLLLLFCIVTYAVATVEGFGWLLLAMGIAQCRPDRIFTLLMYVGTFVLILFYREIPWAELLSKL